MGSDLGDAAKVRPMSAERKKKHERRSSRALGGESKLSSGVGKTHQTGEVERSPTQGGAKSKHQKAGAAEKGALKQRREKREIVIGGREKKAFCSPRGGGGFRERSKNPIEWGCQKLKLLQKKVGRTLQKDYRRTGIQNRARKDAYTAGERKT